MSVKILFRGQRNIVLSVLAILVLTAVAYGVATYQTPYGCANSSGNVVLPDNLPSGSGVSWEVLSKPCFYVYFTGIVGASIFLILLIPVPEKKVEASSVLK
jgi:hypothetical protein